MKYVLFFYLICFQCLIGQKASDLLRFAHTLPYATARSSGVANAVGAVGADLNSLHINPAGLGQFRRSEFALSYHFSVMHGKYLLQGDYMNDEHAQSELPNGLSGIGLVVCTRPKASLWRQLNFAFSLARTADFSQVIHYSGNSLGSIAGRFLELALNPELGGNFGYEPEELDPFEAGLAYQTGVIFDPTPHDGKTNYINDLVGHSSLPVFKTDWVRLRGSLSDFALNIAGNYDEKFSIGGGLTVSAGYLKLHKQYQEHNRNTNTTSVFRQLNFTDSLTTDLAGLKMNLGIIYKPYRAIRLGAAIQSPGILWLHDEFTTGLAYTFRQNNRDTSFKAFSPIGTFEYRLITPSRLTGSLALVSSYGFVSCDVEYTNMKQGFFLFGNEAGSPKDLEYGGQLNREIDRNYRSFFQFRLGGELAIQFFRLRGGIQLIESPFANTKQLGTSYHGGIGFRGNKTYADFAYSLARRELGYVPFQTGNSDFDNDGKMDAVSSLVRQNLINHFFQLTVGFKF